MTTISMVMICRDEEDNVAPCFASWWDDVDEVVLVDTGSTDLTVEVAKAFAADRGEPDKLKIGQFEWCDDFAAARNYADSLATSEWRSWCDLDDEVVGMVNLRQLAEQAGNDVTMLYVRYEYAVDDLGNCFCELWRERLVRASAGVNWVDRVHECQVGQGTFVMVEPDKVRWVHRRAAAEVRDRNELLLRKWVEEEPENPRVLSYLAFELMGSRKFAEHAGVEGSEPDREKVAESARYFQRYLALPSQPPDARAQSTRRYAQVLMTLGEFDEAQSVSLPMLAECPTWPDTYLTLAEVAHEQQDWQRTMEFAKQVLDKGQPETLLIINPEDYTLRPRVMVASAMASLGKLDEACQLAQQVLEKNPSYMNMQQQLAEWASLLAREQTGGMWANCAQLLLQSDEPEKAFLLLQTVPYFSHDHQAVIAMRIAAANALEEPYKVVPVTDSPRGQFLLRGLREQQEQIDSRATEDTETDSEVEAACAS